MYTLEMDEYERHVVLNAMGARVTQLEVELQHPKPAIVPEENWTIARAHWKRSIEVLKQKIHTIEYGEHECFELKNHFPVL
jgi:hypothetical protein